MSMDDLEPSSRGDCIAHELDELADLIERVPELAQLSADDFDRMAYELQMIEFES